MFRNDDFSDSAAPKSPVFPIIMPPLRCIHARIVRHDGLFTYVKVRPFLPMRARSTPTQLYWLLNQFSSYVEKEM